MKKLVGLISAVALLGTGAAFAGGDKHDSQTMRQDESLGTSSGSSATGGSGSLDISESENTSGSQSTSGTGGSGTSGTPSTGGSGTGSMNQGTQVQGSTGSTGTSATGSSAQSPTTLGSQELTGTVVKADKKTLYLDHMGAVVPLKITNQTQFEGEAKRVTDLKEGQQVRASYEIQGKTDNVAKRVELQSGTMQGGQGGSGFEGSPIEDIPSPSEGSGGSPIDPTLDPTLRNPQTVPDTGDTRGPASPLPDGSEPGMGDPLTP